MSITGCVLLVASCDRYSDLWPGFFHCLDRYWPDNPFPVVLGANTKTWPAKGVRSLASPPRLTWTEQLRLQLWEIESDYVLVMLEDFFLRAPVQTAWVCDALEEGKKHGAAMVRLIARPPGQEGGGNHPYIGESPRSVTYRICTQAAFWRRDALLALLVEGESIWEFEHRAESRAATIHGPWLAATRDILPYRGLIFHHVVEKGQWIPSELLRLKLLGVPCDSNRGILPWRPFALLLVAEAFNRVLTFLVGARASFLRERMFALLPVWIVRRYRRARGYSPAK